MGSLLVGASLLAAVPLVLVTTVLLAIATYRGRSRMWLATALLAAVPAAWAVWVRSQALTIGGTAVYGRADLRPSAALLVVLPLLAVAYVLHWANEDEWSPLWAGAIATGAGVVAFFFTLSVVIEQL